ncbi:multicopper oxidase family protein [Actinomycetospora cinnamomea]|uniref:Multicopper oxidase CueO n=1 Tax=Actinomycetospora cinnamomea TaxID=663609 RepID=A0A2U1EUP2_9PSEU|nr:multicopper oxidase domain-containing protein [Actinomycetospora cinnamomea]PVZ03648.1 secreted protein [Actinomycetospora cinnamomea]
MSPLSRRRFLGASLAAAGAAAVASVAGCASGPPTVRPPATPRPLAIPPLAPSTRDAAGRRVVELVAAPGTHEFLPGLATPTWGYGGLPFGGPTVRARRGEEVVLRVTNRLPETTTTHWHGATLPARADGGPHQPIPPGGTWEASWRLDQPAATLWYHPHPHGRTERHVHRGLCGLFLVDDDVPVDLPARYGVDDVPLVLTDRSFTPDGAFDEQHRNAVGLLGDTVLVNSTVAPYLDVTTTRVRLRVLNASPARSYRVVLDDETPLTLVGTDGGLLPAPRVVDGVVLTPGERAEVVVDLVPGRRRVLRSVSHDLGAVNGVTRAAGAHDSFDLLELRPAPRLEPSPPLPARLSREAPLAEAAAARTRRFTLSHDRINGLAMDMTRVDEVVPVAATEIWEFTNRHTLPHNMHVHDARMQVLERGVPAAERPWKDTVAVPPARTVRALVRVGPHADPEVPYMLHCHLLRHEDDGMMLQFLVVAPGQRPATTITGAHDDHG